MRQRSFASVIAGNLSESAHQAQETWQSRPINHKQRQSACVLTCFGGTYNHKQSLRIDPSITGKPQVACALTRGAAPFTKRASAARSAARFSAELLSTSRRVAEWLRVSNPAPASPTAAAALDPDEEPSPRASFRKSSCSAMGTSSSNPPALRPLALLALTRCRFCAGCSAGGDAWCGRAAAAARGGAALADSLLLLPGSAAMSFDSLLAFSLSPTGSLQSKGPPAKVRQ